MPRTQRAAGQDILFDLWRFRAFFTTTDPQLLDTVAADKTHRGHAIIEQVHADLTGSALAHLPSGVFTANAASIHDERLDASGYGSPLAGTDLHRVARQSADRMRICLRPAAHVLADPRVLLRRQTVRAPALHHPRRRPDPRDGGRRDRGAGDA